MPASHCDTKELKEYIRATEARVRDNSEIHLPATHKYVLQGQNMALNYARWDGTSTDSLLGHQVGVLDATAVF